MGRLKLFGIILCLLLLIITIGALKPLSKSESLEILDGVRETLSDDPDVLTIFTNNVLISLIMFVPVIGLIIGTYAIYNTGLVFSSMGTTTEIPSGILLLTTSVLPFFWLEFVAYAASMTQNIILTQNLLKFNIRNELKNLVSVVVLVVLLLLLGAFTEVFIINLVI